MLKAILLSILAAVLVPAFDLQVLLSSTQRLQNGASIRDDDLVKWSFDKLPNDNATDHLVFETTHSLLQHWPNTRMRNGHNIVPGIIPKGTLLYHGSPSKELPLGPEWVATDPEHSYLFCRDQSNHSSHGGWHLTLMATRPLKVVYFDGSSAAKLPYGTFDTQDLIVWGKLGDDDIFGEETKRIQDLCSWGKSLGVDGFVRMEMDFEIMFCNFTSGVNVVSFEYLATGWIGPTINREIHMFEVVHTGSWFPGETRIQLDLSGLVSFYDTQLAPSLVAIRAGQERWNHRVQNVSSEDLSTIKLRLEANLIRPNGASSGIDWKTLLQVIVDRYAQRLELLRYLLNISATTPDDILDLAKKAQTQLRTMLTPYILFGAAPNSHLSDEVELDWTIPIYKLCATTHTYAMESFESMTDSEKLLLKAIRGTNREICRVVTKMWAIGVHAGVDASLNTKDYPVISEVAKLRDTWAMDLVRLMGWLDWNVWVKCDPECSPEEMCYLPTWPIGFPPMTAGPGRKPWPNPWPQAPENVTSLDLRAMVTAKIVDEFNNTRNLIEPRRDEWIRPQPKCIRRVEPYKY